MLLFWDNRLGQGFPDPTGRFGEKWQQWHGTPNLIFCNRTHTRKSHIIKIHIQRVHRENNNNVVAEDNMLGSMP